MLAAAGTAVGSVLVTLSAGIVRGYCLRVSPESRFGWIPSVLLTCRS